MQPTAVAAAPDMDPHMSRIGGVKERSSMGVGVSLGVASCPLRVLQ